ncbi:hypothetical protein CBL_03589 [Carabus blaptoides fortunei]
MYQQAVTVEIDRRNSIEVRMYTPCVTTCNTGWNYSPSLDTQDGGNLRLTLPTSRMYLVVNGALSYKLKTNHRVLIEKHEFDLKWILFRIPACIILQEPFLLVYIVLEYRREYKNLDKFHPHKNPGVINKFFPSTASAVFEMARRGRILNIWPSIKRAKNRASAGALIETYECDEVLSVHVRNVREVICGERELFGNVGYDSLALWREGVKQSSVSTCGIIILHLPTPSACAVEPTRNVAAAIRLHGELDCASGGISRKFKINYYPWLFGRSTDRIFECTDCRLSRKRVTAHDESLLETEKDIKSTRNGYDKVVRNCGREALLQKHQQPVAAARSIPSPATHNRTAHNVVLSVIDSTTRTTN